MACTPTCLHQLNDFLKEAFISFYSWNKKIAPLVNFASSVILHMICLFVMFSESVMCYVGQFMKNPYTEKLNSNKITLSRCPGTTECATVNYQMKVSGISIQVAQGICGSKQLVCDAVCGSMKRIMKYQSFLKCKVRLYFAEVAVHKFRTEYAFCNFRRSHWFFSFFWLWLDFFIFLFRISAR